MLFMLEGKEVLVIYKVFYTWGNGEESFAKIMKMFENHCVPITNVTYEREMLKMRTWNEGETVEEFVTDSKLKSQSCKYGMLIDSLIKDQIVLGYNN